MRDAVYHPQTNEKIPIYGRWSAFVPLNIPITLGMNNAATLGGQVRAAARTAPFSPSPVSARAREWAETVRFAGVLAVGEPDVQRGRQLLQPQRLQAHDQRGRALRSVRALRSLRAPWCSRGAVQILTAYAGAVLTSVSIIMGARRLLSVRGAPLGARARGRCPDAPARAEPAHLGCHVAAPFLLRPLHGRGGGGRVESYPHAQGRNGQWHCCGERGER